MDAPDGLRAAEPPPTALSIGAVFGGSYTTDETWRPAIQRLTSEVIALRAGVESALEVNVVFHIDGALLPPVDFEGVRTGKFSRKRMLLLVQAVVPVEAVGDRYAVLVGLLCDAVGEAEAFAKRKHIADGLPEVRSIVDAL